MRAGTELPMRRLTLTLATLVLLLSIVSTWILQYLPDEPLHLRRNLTAYAAFVVIVSCLGLIGGIQRNATLINLFASHLLLDAILYFIPRTLLLNLSLQLPTILCTSSPATGDIRNVSPYSVRHDTLVERSWRRVYKPQWIEGESCQAWTWSFEIFFLAALVTVMGAQVWCALKVRGYAGWLDRMERQERERLEKKLEIC